MEKRENRGKISKKGVIEFKRPVDLGELEIVLASLARSLAGEVSYSYNASRTFGGEKQNPDRNYVSDLHGTVKLEDPRIALSFSAEPNAKQLYHGLNFTVAGYKPGSRSYHDEKLALRAIGNGTERYFSLNRE